MTNGNQDIRELYQKAVEARALEIDLFWRRSNYFLVLSTAIAVAYFAPISADAVSSLDTLRPWVAGFGALIAIAWFMVNLGSKFWQSRWEERACVLEQKIYGSHATAFGASMEVIRKDVLDHIDESKHSRLRRPFDLLVLLKPSVSFIMTLLPLLFTALWLVALHYSVCDCVT